MLRSLRFKSRVTSILRPNEKPLVKVFINDRDSFRAEYNNALALIGSDKDKEEAHFTPSNIARDIKHVFFEDGRFIQVDTH